MIDEHPGARPPDLALAIEEVSWLGRAPITVDLLDGGVVGIVGDRRTALAVARSLLCQAAVHHGPADLPIIVACDEQAVDDWDWAKWLPHVDEVSSGTHGLAAGRDATDALAEALLRERADRDEDAVERRTVVVVVDGDGLLDGRRAPLRRVLEGRGGAVAGIVVAASADRLPAMCTAVFGVDAETSMGELRRPGRVERPTSVAPSGLADATARCCARALAGLDDPELDRAGAGLPAMVRLVTLLDLDLDATSLPAAVAERWRRRASTFSLTVPIGVDAAGVVELDLDADGPHALVAGTTGAGKSELLRSLVVGLAAGSSPEHLTFVLVDFKGGSAFDACARLPHTVGLVTDLDAALAERALRCLEAELRHREHRLRSVGASDLRGYLRLREGDASLEPLPRLVVVVDEFATLRSELPDFVDALVGVAQRGRSLGVHLVLATQRPAGAVSDHVKANTNLRIALRVQDRSDSIDVIDVAEAASLPRGRPGRACVRFGPGEVTTLQTALVTARPGPAARAVEVRPFTFVPSPSSPATTVVAGEGTDLDRLVDACVAAWAATHAPAPRRPWPDPLPTLLSTDALAAAGRGEPAAAGTVAAGLADDPDRQRQLVTGWRPADGNLLVYGVGGSGTTTTLLALALALAGAAPPDAVQLFAVDHGAGDLRVLAGLPHVAAVLGATELERQARLVRHLRAELDRRRDRAGDGAPCRPIVVLLDGAAAFLAAFDDIAGMEIVDAFGRVIADGPALDIHVVLTADRAGAVPAALSATMRQRWIHRLADPMEASAAGAPAGSPSLVAALPAGRFLDADSGLLVQVAVPACGWAAACAAVAARWPGRRAQEAAAAVRTLPACVSLDALGVAAVLGSERPWIVPVGVADHDLGPAGLPLHEGDHVLIAGPGRSGRTTALAMMATAVRAARADAVLVGIASRRSWLGSVPAIEVVGSVPDAAESIKDAAGRGVPAFLFVDDADTVDDADAVLASLVGDATGGHVVAAGRAEVLRGLYTHWTRTLRRSRTGLLLCPHPDLDGELLGAALPAATGCAPPSWSRLPRGGRRALPGAGGDGGRIGVVTEAATATDLWADAVGQEHARAQLGTAAVDPVHAYLLLGHEGWGAQAVAAAFAADVLAAGLEGDEAERVRALVAVRGHADLVTVEPEGNQLRTEEVDELVRLAFRAPTERPHKVLLLPRFDTAGPVAWSRMLKVLEEPPPSTVWVLLADDLPPEMATIGSRSVVIRLDPVPAAAVAQRLVAEGHAPAAAETAAMAAAGDLALARLLVGDERLALRVDAWRAVPSQLDGSGAVVWRLVAELRSAIDDGLAHVKASFEAAEAELAERITELGLPKGRARELADSHRRQLRRARTAELRLGLATLAGRYRDAMGEASGRPAPYRRALIEAVAAIDVTHEALAVRNANEALQLQALLLRLPPVT